MFRKIKQMACTHNWIQAYYLDNERGMQCTKCIKTVIVLDHWR